MASGEEYVVRQAAATPLSVNKVEPLTNSEKMDIMVLSANPMIMSLWKFLEMEIIAARDEAMAVDPSQRDEQLAKLTIAHAMQKFYTRVRDDIKFMTQEHLAHTQQLNWEKTIAADPKVVEDIYFSQ